MTYIVAKALIQIKKVLRFGYYCKILLKHLPTLKLKLRYSSCFKCYKKNFKQSSVNKGKI